MVAYLSEEWVTALDEALSRAAADAPGAGAGDEPVVVQYRVPDGPDGPRAWYLALGPAALGARPGLAEAPTVTFTQGWAVATAIARGERSAPEAVLAGDVLVSGEANRLLPWRDRLRSVADAVARLAAATQFPDRPLLGTAGVGG